MWADERVRELAKDFVLATDEVWQLQHRRDAEAKLFQRMTRDVDINGKFETKQGTYVCTPSGQLLASANSNNPDRILSIMRRGLRAWPHVAEHHRELPPQDFQPTGRFEPKYPEDGLVLVMMTRDLPASADPTALRAKAWNQDTIWYSALEARQWLPEQLDDDRPHEVPRGLVERLARFHLVDTVKGQTSAFASEDVQGARMTTWVTEREGDLIQLAIEGTTRSVSDWDENRRAHHGVETQLVGTASYDQTKQKFVAFDLVALGRRWGQTRFNDRQRDLEESPVGFVMELASDDAPRIPPAFIYAYDAPWLQE